MRFRPEQRLRRPGDFRDTREKGRRLDCGGFTIWYHRRPDRSESAFVVVGENESGAPHGEVLAKPAPAAFAGPRVGVVASRAAVGNAVQRNRAKRRFREVFRRNQDKVPAGLDLMIAARGVVNNWAYADIERKFLEACRKLTATAR